MTGIKCRILKETRMKKVIPLLILVFGIILPISVAESGVHILSENLEQMVTSTTLKWISADSTMKEFENGVIGTYEVEQDDTLDDNDTPNSIKKPVYVCRGRQNGLWLAGHLRTTDHRCLVTHYGNVFKLDRYEVLINTENSARLSWVRRDKYTLDPQGAVAGGYDTYKNFVARTAPMGDDDAKEIPTRILGKLDPNVNFGKYTFVDKNNKQLQTEDGEILVETEPIRYEMKRIKYDRVKKPQPKEEKILGQTVLKNEESLEVSTVETVISYNYTYKLNWGHGHGLLIGLPFDVYENDNVSKHKWGIPEVRQIIRTFDIRYYLQPGTAVNVTLRGDYVDGEYPYTATIISHYRDLGSQDRLIKDNKRETTMRNIVPEFGPVYFLKNNSFVPTTTTTTTTTTTATTTKKTTTATEPLPINPPEIEDEITKMKKVKDMESGKKHENNSMMSDDGELSSLQKKDGTPSNSPSNTFISNGFLILSAVMFVMRLT